MRNESCLLKCKYYIDGGFTTGYISSEYNCLAMGFTNEFESKLLNITGYINPRYNDVNYENLDKLKKDFHKLELVEFKFDNNTLYITRTSDGVIIKLLYDCCINSSNFDVCLHSFCEKRINIYNMHYVYINKLEEQLNQFREEIDFMENNKDKINQIIRALAPPSTFYLNSKNNNKFIQFIKTFNIDEYNAIEIKEYKLLQFRNYVHKISNTNNKTSLYPFDRCSFPFQLCGNNISEKVVYKYLAMTNKLDSVMLRLEKKLLELS